MKNIYKNLANDGVVVISEWPLYDEKTGPASAALMALNMIIETHGGKNHSYAEIVGKLNQAGFKKSERRSLAEPAGYYHLVTNHKQKRQKEKIGAFLRGLLL